MAFIQKLILASYLHDIGKLAVRAGERRQSGEKDYAVAHSQMANDILDEFNSKYWSEVGTIASHHHGRDFSDLLKDENISDEIKFLAWCVYMADNISAGERINKAEEDEISQTGEHLSWGMDKIFLTFNFGLQKLKKENRDKWVSVKLSKFTGTSGEINQAENFKSLWNEFKDKLAALLTLYSDGIPENQFQSFIYKLDLLLQNYLTLVPSDTYKSDIADISLYDHSKTVVVFAQILYEAFKDYKNKSELYRLSTDKVIDLLKTQNFKVPLIAGDFAGIQRYITGGIKKTDKASKRLRARSLIVQLLSEAVLHYILQKFNLPPANVLINAGGKFVVVGRNSEEDLKKSEEKINNIKSEVNEFLIKEFPGVKVVLVSQDYDVEQIVGREQGNNFKYVLEDLFEKLGESKFRVYNEENLRLIFTQEGISGKILCKYCGLHYVDSEEETADVRCIWCDREIGLGELIVKKSKEFKNGEKGLFVDFEKNGKFAFEYKIKPVGQDNEGNKIWDLIDNGGLKFQFNNWDLNEGELTADYLIVGKSVNLYVPDDGKGNVKSFEDLLKQTNSDYLVMVKGDVDNMSLVLKYGLPDRFYTLSRILTFSRFLELYFGKVLNDWLAQEWKNVYTVFSGGDDFVFVMPFFVDESKDLIDFVKAFYGKWQDFIGENPFLHFSAGLGIFKSKTPLKFVYQDSESILKDAKNVVKESYGDLKEVYEAFCNDDENCEQVKQKAAELLKQFAVAGFDKGHFVIYGLEDRLEEILLRFDDLKECELEKFVKSEVKSGVIYKFYQVLRQVYQELAKGENANWADIVLNLSKLSYMLVRNLDFKDDDSKIEFKRWFSEKFGKLKDEKDFKRRIVKMLFKLAYRIYLQRQKS